MSLADAKAAIKLWLQSEFTDLFGTQYVPVAWRDEARVWVGKARILLKLSSIRGYGVDECRWEEDATMAPFELVPTICGQRGATLSILAESRDQRSPGDAEEILHTVRRSSRKPGFLALLRDAGVAIAERYPTVDLSDVVQDRVESRAHMDLLLNLVDNETDLRQAEYMVEKISASADFGGTAGWEDDTFGWF